MTQAVFCPECGAALPAEVPQGLCPRCLLRRGLQSRDSTPASDAATPTGPYVGPSAPSPIELARHFPQLEVLELLGQGGMGAVYKARQPGLDRLVALKILPPEAGRDPAFAERFTREARALARLSHPNIVAVYDFGQTDELYYLVMEYVDGPNLRQLSRQGELKPREALKIVPQICDALQFAHDEGVVHRDIKPENILLDKKGRVKIADFGLAKLLGRPASGFNPAAHGRRASGINPEAHGGRASGINPEARGGQASGLIPEAFLTGPQQVMGTPYYMAPEQMERPLEVDHRADIYSLGVVLYELLTGELPLGRFAPPSRKVGVDVRLDEVVLRTLEKEPGRRYQSVSEVKTHVESICGRADGRGHGFGIDYRSRRAIRGWPLVHVATGFDPVTGQRRIAKGIVAVGDVAVGVVAFGGGTVGIVSVGGIGLGVVSWSGIAIGIVAVGGFAVGGIAFGGFAVGLVALGGAAIGWYATGGQAVGIHANDATADAFFRPWLGPWVNWVSLSSIGLSMFLGAAWLGVFLRRVVRSFQRTHV